MKSEMRQRAWCVIYYYLGAVPLSCVCVCVCVGCVGNTFVNIHFKHTARGALLNASDTRPIILLMHPVGDGE